MSFICLFIRKRSSTASIQWITHFLLFRICCGWCRANSSTYYSPISGPTVVIDICLVETILMLVDYLRLEFHRKLDSKTMRWKFEPKKITPTLCVEILSSTNVKIAFEIYLHCINANAMVRYLQVEANREIKMRFDMRIQWRFSLIGE